MPRLDLDVVRHALSTARRLGYREVELELGEDHFHAKLAPAPPSTQVSEQPLGSDSVPAEDIRTITASAVGYYRQGETPLVAEALIEKGDKVAVVVSLGIENDVESKWSGKVLEVLVRPDQPVEFGQPLARISVDAQG